MKRLLCFVLIVSFILSFGITSMAAEDIEMDIDTGEVDASLFEENDEAAILQGDDITVSAPYAILMEKETGTIIYEKDADVKTPPASVTKVMSILLFMEAIEKGELSLDEPVSVSAHAASMGGSQVWLEEGEQMSVHDMLKCVIVVSANDATVALGERISGTEEAFVTRMNEKAAELGMTNTVFTNCTGLMDDPNHVTTARDIAIMSREVMKYDLVKDYTTIWMDTVRDGEFGLSNTNKLIFYYDGATGLKTGFTHDAMYCLSATAERDGVEYIAVVLHCETSADRFESAKTLLSYGFSNYALCDTSAGDIPEVPVILGKENTVRAVLDASDKILVKKADLENITKELSISERLTAPITKGQEIGKLTVKNGDEIIMTIPIKAEKEILRKSTGDIYKGLLKLLFSESPVIIQ